MVIEHYNTIATSGEGFYKEKGSKFIGLSFPVKNEDEVKTRLEETRNKFHDARHHCYAFVLGADRKTYRANDDGEPNHSAGDPILGQINSKELTDTLVVVVRYFGGTKLGVSGLIGAYKTAAEEALNKSKVVTVDVTKRVVIEYSYDATSEVMRLVDEFELEISDQTFEAKCTITGNVKIGLLHAFEEKIKLLQATGSSVNSY